MWWIRLIRLWLLAAPLILIGSLGCRIFWAIQSLGIKIRGELDDPEEHHEKSRAVYVRD